MVAPGFGFSVGDFIAGGQFLVHIISAFKEADGASSKYASEVSFLNCLKSTLDHLERFAASSSTSENDDDLPAEISKLLQEIWGPWEEFKKFLDKYEPSLGANSSKSKLAKAPRTIQYTVKDISGKVEKLRNQTEQPLQAVNSLLSLHVLKTLEKLPGQVLQPVQCSQLVEAITLADIPTELDKQLRVLQLAADEHNIKQDQQLEVIWTLRNQLKERISGLETALDSFRNPDPAAKDRHDEQLDASRTVHTRVDQLSAVLECRADQLESAMKEQKQLLLALKSFLEDKTSRSESEMQSGHGSWTESENQNSWPSATLSTAYFGALLLSSVLSSIAATSIVTKQRNYEGNVRPAFVPVDYSLPGLGTLNKTIQIEPQLTEPVDEVAISTSPREVVVSTHVETNFSTKETLTSTQPKPKDSNLSKVSEWLLDYSRTQRAVRRPDEQRPRSFSRGPDWRPLAVLRNPEPGEGPDGNHEDRPDGDSGSGSHCGSEPNTGSFHDGPGPAILADNGGFNWGFGGDGVDGDGDGDGGDGGGGCSSDGGGGYDSDSS